MTKTKNDIAWEFLFRERNILSEISNNGFYNISSSVINVRREARLMTKFDNKAQLPEIFKLNDLTILPISRKGYVIGNFKTYHEFEVDDTETIRIEPPLPLESLDFNNLTSEASVINSSFVSQILQKFTEEETLYPTVNGRMSSEIFNFSIQCGSSLTKIDVTNSQIEIDGGFEGENSLNLIEAKNYLADDFLIRQLFYPFKLWSSKIQKIVRPIFLTYSNGVFRLKEYVFDDPTNYNSIRLLRQKKYSIKDGAINMEFIQSIADSQTTVREPRIPFPQANDFSRVINMCELIKENRNYLSKEELTINYAFDDRQTDYYSNAARYLGLLQWNEHEEQIVCELTEEGNKIFNLAIDERQSAFIKLILSHKAFKESMKLYLSKGSVPSKEDIVEITQHSNLFNVNSESTYFRRASTIIGWLIWILDQTEE